MARNKAKKSFNTMTLVEAMTHYTSRTSRRSWRQCHKVTFLISPSKAAVNVTSCCDVIKTEMAEKQGTNLIKGTRYSHSRQFSGVRNALWEIRLNQVHKVLLPLQCSVESETAKRDWRVSSASGMVGLPNCSKGQAVIIWKLNMKCVIKPNG